MKIIISFIIINCISIFSQTNDEQFNTFFQNFKNAVKENNVSALLEMTNFPFLSLWGGNPLNQFTKEEFTANPVVPEYSSLSKAKFDKTVSIKKTKSEEESVTFKYIDGYYIISFDYYSNIDQAGGYIEYYFGMINGEYKYIKNDGGD